MSQTETVDSDEKCIHIKVLYDMKSMIGGYLERDLPEVTKEHLRRTLESLDDLPVCK